MATLRDIIFEDIRSDYNNNGEESLLYRFLREKKGAEKDKINKVATDFMYNHGYPLAKGKRKYTDYATGEVIEKETERKTVKKEEKISKSRTSSTALGLFDAWYLERGARVLRKSKKQANEKDYQVLFDLLKYDHKNEKTFIPVYIDSTTGAGLYIMGKRLIPRDDWKYGKDFYCGLFISAWVLPEGKDSIIRYENYEQMDDLKECTSISEALKFFLNDLDELEVDYLNGIMNNNKNAPENCPGELKMYFADYDIEKDKDFGSEDTFEDERAKEMIDFDSER